MIKIAFVMIVVYFSDGHLYMSEIDYLPTKEQCEAYAAAQVEEHIKNGIPVEHLNSTCIQVVVPTK